MGVLAPAGVYVLWPRRAARLRGLPSSPRGRQPGNWACSRAPPPCPPECGYCCLRAVDWHRYGVCWHRATVVCAGFATPGATNKSLDVDKVSFRFQCYAPPRTRPHLCHHRARKLVFAAPAPSAETAFARAQWIKRCVHRVHVTHTYAHALGFVICVVGSRTDPLPAHVPPRAAMAPRCGYC